MAGEGAHGRVLGLFDSLIALIDRCGHQQPSLPQPVACSGDCCKLRLVVETCSIATQQCSGGAGSWKLLAGERGTLVRVVVACLTVRWAGSIDSIVHSQRCCSRLHAAVTTASCDWYARQAVSPHTVVSCGKGVCVHPRLLGAVE